MGTNYTLKLDICPCCKVAKRELHIGKSSGGWVFSLHVIPEEDIDNLEDWIALFYKEHTQIIDEYNCHKTPEQMIDIICNRKWPEKNQSLTNTCEFGPNNLLRSIIDHVHCVGHGKGTWAYHTGDFS